MFEIADDNGVIHAGSEEEMRLAFKVMRFPHNYSKDKVEQWEHEWEGDLRLLKLVAST